MSKLLRCVLLSVVPLCARAQAAPVRATGSFFALSVADARASATWYAEKFDMHIVMNAPRNDQTRSAAIVLEGNGLTVELVQHDDAQPLRTAAPSLRGGSLYVHGIMKAGFVVDDFDATLATLRARNVEIAMGPFPKRENQKANVIIKDNAGNLIQIIGK